MERSRGSIEGWWEARLFDEAFWHGGMVHPEIRIGDGTARTSMAVHPTSQKRDVGHPASIVPITEAAMQQNRETYRAINPLLRASTPRS